MVVCSGFLLDSVMGEREEAEAGRTSRASINRTAALRIRQSGGTAGSGGGVRAPNDKGGRPDSQLEIFDQVPSSSSSAPIARSGRGFDDGRVRGTMADNPYLAHLPPHLRGGANGAATNGASSSTSSSPGPAGNALEGFLARKVNGKQVEKAMHHDVNPFTRKPYTKKYKEILEVRKKLPVFKQVRPRSSTGIIRRQGAHAFGRR